MTSEQSERLSKIEDNVDNLYAQTCDINNALAKTNGEIEKLDVKLNAKIDNMGVQMGGNLGVSHQKLVGLEDKIDQIVANTTKKKDNKIKLLIALAAAAAGAAAGFLFMQIEAF